MMMTTEFDDDDDDNADDYDGELSQQQVKNNLTLSSGQVVVDQINARKMRLQVLRAALNAR